MATSPKVILRSSLRLDGEKETRLMEHCIKRRNSVRTEMGWMNGTATSGMGVVAGVPHWRGMSCTGWAQKRQEIYSMYENDFTFRSLPGNSKRFSSLFQHFNKTVNVPARAVNVFKARACENLVNTSPFTGFMPEGNNDPADPIKFAERYFNSALEDGEARFYFREGIKQACLSEAVMKIALVPQPVDPQLVDNAQFYLGTDGEPIRDSRGGYVFNDEELDDDPTKLGVKVLKRDPTVELDGTEQLSPPQTMVRTPQPQSKLDMQPVGWQNFFCSILEPDIHKADNCFHEFDEDFDILMKRIQVSGQRINPSAKKWLEDMKNSMQTGPQAEGNQPVGHRGEREVEMYGPVKIHICEQWIRYDVFDRGEADELCVTWAVSSNGTEAQPIYYDLMKNASATGKRPFEVIRVIPVTDRWYGMGFYDLLSNDHDFVDDAWNRIYARSTASGRMDWMRRGSFEGTEQGQQVSLSSGKTYWLKNDIPIDSPITAHAGSIAFQALDEKIWKMLEMALQTAQLRSGTMTASDAAMSSLPANNTATGQDLLANESNLMSNDTTQDVIRGIIATLKQGIVALFSPAHFDAPAANLVLGVEPATKLSQWLQTNSPAKFSAHAKLLLTKARSKQALEAAVQVNQLMTGGLSWVAICQTMPLVAAALKPLFVDMLNAHDQSNSDQILSQVLNAIMQQIAQQQAAAAAAAAAAQPPGATPAPGAPPGGSPAAAAAQQVAKLPMAA